MLRKLRSVLSAADITLFEDAALRELDAGQPDSAREPIKKLLRAQPRDREAALALIRIVENGSLPIEHGLDIFEKVFRAHRDDPEVAAKMGHAADCVRDLDELNAAPPESAVFEQLADALEKFVEQEAGTRNEIALLEALATTTRMMGRQRDHVCERSYRRLVELDPGTSYQHYNLGLFFKTRGRFREGLQANRASARLRSEPNQACEWNAGICATGAGDGAAALEVWQRM
jgi:tetratricopeptide (TPR) repeat protein